MVGKRLVYTLSVAVLAFMGSAVEAVPAPSAGSASYLYPVHSTRHGYRVVYVDDRTGSRWPVKAAVSAWDVGTDVSVRYGPCRALAGCVRVVEAYYGRSGWVGQTWASWDTRGVYTGTVTVKLNNSYSYGARQTQTTATHEIGHALGLMYHRTGKGSPMYKSVDYDVNPWPSTADKAALNGLY